MEKIVAQGRYTLLRDSGNESSEDASFNVDLENGILAQVSVSYGTNEIVTVINDLDVSDGFVESIKSIKRFDFDSVPEKLRKETSLISQYLVTATKRVISLIKYYLRHLYISESLFSIKEVKWGGSINDLYDLPSSLSSSLSIISSEPLRDNTINNIQSALNNKIEPLIAMRHLHRARMENIAHHKWIDATIAAELAVKEVLSKVCPELELLLMEMPSPPLSKLYGSILENYLGERSPYLKQIRNGVEVRNRLIHKPYAEQIDQQEANDYVAYIEAAIFHLLYKLYPNELLIENACARTNH